MSSRTRGFGADWSYRLYWLAAVNNTFPVTSASVHLIAGIYAMRCGRNGEVFNGKADLAALTGLSDASVTRARGALRDAGFIVDTGRRRQRAVVWRLVISPKAVLPEALIGILGLPDDVAPAADEGAHRGDEQAHGDDVEAHWGDEQAHSDEPLTDDGNRRSLTGDRPEQTIQNDLVADPGPGGPAPLTDPPRRSTQATGPAGGGPVPPGRQPRQALAARPTEPGGASEEARADTNPSRRAPADGERTADQLRYPVWSEHGARIDSAAELTARGGAAYWPDEWPDGELDGAWCWRGTPDGDERVPIEDHFPHGAPWPRDGQRRTA